MDRKKNIVTFFRETLCKFINHQDSLTARFSKFNSQNVILFQIKLFVRNIKETTLGRYFIKVTACPTRLSVIRRTIELIKYRNGNISYNDSVILSSYLNLLECLELWMFLLPVVEFELSFSVLDLVTLLHVAFCFWYLIFTGYFLRSKSIESLLNGTSFLIFYENMAQ